MNIPEVDMTIKTPWDEEIERTRAAPPLIRKADSWVHVDYLSYLTSRARAEGYRLGYAACKREIEFLIERDAQVERR